MFESFKKEVQRRKELAEIVYISFTYNGHEVAFDNQRFTKNTLPSNGYVTNFQGAWCIRSEPTAVETISGIIYECEVTPEGFVPDLSDI